MAVQPTLTRPLYWQHYVRIVLVAAFLIVTTPLTLHSMSNVGSVGFDFEMYGEAARRYFDGGLYASTDTYAYRYSPVLAPALIGVEWLGISLWRALHVVALLALPLTWPVRLMLLVSWPFWFDVSTGNVMVFLVLAAAWAVRGNRYATGAFLVAALLIPKPLLLPVLAWLLWQRQEWRRPFIVMAVIHGVAVLATGWADEWLYRLVASGDEMGLSINLAPSRFLGWWWMLVAAPLAVWLTVKGRLGWASLMASPYWLPYYLLLPLAALERHDRPEAVKG